MVGPPKQNPFILEKIRDFPLHGCGLYLRSCVLGWEWVSWSLYKWPMRFREVKDTSTISGHSMPGVFIKLWPKIYCYRQRVVFFPVFVGLCLSHFTIIWGPHHSTYEISDVYQCLKAEAIIKAKDLKKSHCYRQGPRQNTSYLLPWKLRIDICFF